MAKMTTAERAKIHNREHTKQFVFRFRLCEDRDIIKKLESVESKIGYIRELILKDMKNNIDYMEGIKNE